MKARDLDLKKGKPTFDGKALKDKIAEPDKRLKYCVNYNKNEIYQSFL